MLSLGKRGEMITEFLRSRFCAEQPLVVALSKHSPDIVGMPVNHEYLVALANFDHRPCKASYDSQTLAVP